jgi:L-methionine (R)-S-oxide reductase
LRFQGARDRAGVTVAEVTSDLRTLPRAEAWTRVIEECTAILEGIDDPVAAMATLSCLLHHGFGWLWCGFYRVVAPDLLRVGPYQGTLGCLEIQFGRGVCGTAARERRTIVVPDVHAFPGHITCDSRSASELVVPVYDPHGALIAVLDLDAETPGAFGEVDARGAERLVAWFAREGPA